MVAIEAEISLGFFSTVMELLSAFPGLEKLWNFEKKETNYGIVANI